MAHNSKIQKQLQAKLETVLGILENHQFPTTDKVKGNKLKSLVDKVLEEKQKDFEDEFVEEFKKVLDSKAEYDKYCEEAEKKFNAELDKGAQAFINKLDALTKMVENADSYRQRYLSTIATVQNNASEQTVETEESIEEPSQSSEQNSEES